MLHFVQMSNTISVRLPEDLAQWLVETSEKTGVSQGRIIRDQLEKLRQSEEPPFMRLAGSTSSPADLSTREGFSKK